MKYILIMMLVFAGLSAWAFVTARNGPADDFGQGVIAWLLAAVTVLLAVAYVAMILWNHRFW